MHDAEFQYLTGQARPGFPALFDEFERRSADAVRGGACEIDLRYGTPERCTFDFFDAGPAARGVLVYLHAGYWQWRDKAGFRFIAPALVRRGLHVAMVNYPLCPTVSLADLTDTVRTAVPAVLGRVDAALPLVAMGHSAGGHLAMEMALTDWTARGLPMAAVAGVIALSGLYDLAPLAQTSLNENLRLDAPSAAAASPLYRAVPDSPPLLLAAGADETPAMREQSRRMHEVWLAMGNPSILHYEPHADHFSLLQRLVAPRSALGRQVDRLLERALD
jgi:arylformamidase